MITQTPSREKSKPFFILVGIVLTLLFLPIVLADTEIYPVNKEVDLKFTCTLNNAIPSPTTEFNISINYPNGTTFINNQPATALGNGAFNYTTTFTQTGIYQVQMFCSDGTYSYSNEGFYDITPTGTEATVSISMLYISLLSILLFLLIFSLSKITVTGDYAWAIGFTSLSYFLLLSVFFVSYKLSANFLVEIPYLTTILYWLFFITFILLLPFILIMIFYLLSKVANEKEIEKLVGMGYTKDEAQKIKRKK